MASDLKMEIFAYNIFHDAWVSIGVGNTEMSIFQIYGDECMKDNTYTVACDKIFSKAIYSRFYLFKKKYFEEIDLDYVMKWKSLSEYFDYVTRFCDREDMFGHLTVFEKMFATCAFVICLAMYGCRYCHFDIRSYSHIVWAMYFDKFSNQFYEKGGWIELKRIAKTYDLMHDFINIYGDSWDSNIFKEASINYLKFKNGVKYVNCKKLHKDKFPVSMLWIRFQIEQFEDRDTISFQDFDAVSDCELLLQDLKQIFNFSLKCDSDNAKLLEDKFHERRISWNISESSCNEIPNSIDYFETQVEDEIPVSSKKGLNPEMTNKIENFGCKNDSTEVGILGQTRDVNLEEYSNRTSNYLYDRTKCPQFETDMENSTKLADSEVDYDCKNISFDSEGEKGLNNIPSAGNFERLTEEMNVKETLSTNREEYELLKQISPKNLPNSKDFHSKSKTIPSQHERGSSCHSLKSNVCSEYKRTCDQDGTLTVKEMATTKREKSEIPKKLFVPTDFLTANKVIKRSEEKAKTNMELENLHREQNDPEICRFLRMILVLDDKQGLQHHRCLPCNNEKKKKRKIKKKNKEKIDLKK